MAMKAMNTDPTGRGGGVGGGGAEKGEKVAEEIKNKDDGVSENHTSFPAPLT